MTILEIILTVTFGVFILLDIILIPLYIVLAIKTSNTNQTLKKYSEYLNNESKKLKDETMRLNEKKWSFKKKDTKVKKRRNY